MSQWEWVRDVTDDCVVVGNPARIICRNGVRVNEDLTWRLD